MHGHAKGLQPLGEGKAHQQRADAAEQGADGVKPPQALRMEPSGRFNAQHGGKPAQ